MKYDFLIEKLTLSSKRTHKTVTSFPESKWLDSPANDLKTAKELFTHILVARWTHFQFIKDLNVDREKFGVHIRRLTPKTPSELIAEEQKMSEEMVSYFSGLSESDWESAFLGGMVAASFPLVQTTKGDITVSGGYVNVDPGHAFNQAGARSIGVAGVKLEAGLKF